MENTKKLSYPTQELIPTPTLEMDAVVLLTHLEETELNQRDVLTVMMTLLKNMLALNMSTDILFLALHRTKLECSWMDETKLEKVLELLGKIAQLLRKDNPLSKLF